MILLLQQALCLSLLLVSAGLVVVEIRTRLERSFLYFGLALALLCIFCAIDLWDAHAKSWLQLQHAAFCFFPPMMLRYLMLLAGKQPGVRWKHFLWTAGAVSLASISGIMFRDAPDYARPTSIYYILFLPYLAASVISVFWFLAAQSTQSARKDRSLHRLHLWGLIALTLAGIVDLVQLLIGYVFISSVPSIMIFGVLALGSVLAYVFTERLVLLIRERLMYIEKLQSSYRELEHAKSLSEIGKSTAIINHEIKNYTCVISGYAQYVHDQASLPDKYKGMLTTIIETATKLSGFSNEILDFSKAKILSNKRPLAIASLIDRCAKTNFAGSKATFTLENFQPDFVIHGDWSKLEQVFVNLFKNALEAEAHTIRVKLIPSNYVMLVTVEDDGVGCDVNQFGKLFEAFHTTKETGTGLGLPTSRSIVEGHGGYMSAVSRNLARPGEHGLIFNLAFPLYDTAPAKSDNIVFVKDHIEQLAEVIQVFRNVFVVPHVVESAEELMTSVFKPSEVRVLANPHVVAEIVGRREGYQCFSLVAGSDRVIRALGSPPEQYEGVFSEEFVLTQLAGRTAAIN